MKKLSAIIFLLTISLNFYAHSSNSGSEAEPLKILFIGSSYFYSNDLAGLFENLTASSGQEVYIDNYYPCGLYLAHHAFSDISEAKIKEKKWDYIVLQGVGANTAYPEHFTEHPVYPALLALREKISANWDSTRIVFSMPWAFEDGMTWVEGWKDQFSDMQVKIYENTLKLSDSTGFITAPVGWAWLKVLQEKKFPLHYLHISDWNHPSLKGSYLMACVIYSTIFQESIEGNSFYSDLQKDDAVYFQEMASKTVLKNPGLWNMPEIIVGFGGASGSDRFLLHQNYPNPFRSGTVINYEIRIAGPVKVSLYDCSGRKCSNLVNTYQLPGKYRIKINAYLLPAGIYYYTLQTGTDLFTKQMLVIN